jgi:succinate dehydrogenase/fumarate reductase flavoprotein subunit
VAVLSLEFVMCRFVTILVIGIATLTFGTFARAEGEIKPSVNGEPELVIDEKLKEEFPPTFPTARAILLAAREGKGRPKNEHIHCKLVKYDVSAPRIYPNVGNARVARSQFECTVTSDEGRKVVYIGQCRLITVK